MTWKGIQVIPSSKWLVFSENSDNSVAKSFVLWLLLSNCMIKLQVTLKAATLRFLQ